MILEPDYLLDYLYVSFYYETKNLKGTNKCVRKRKLNSKDYKHCLEVTQLESKINQLEKSLRKS